MVMSFLEENAVVLEMINTQTIKTVAVIVAQMSSQGAKPVHSMEEQPFVRPVLLITKNLSTFVVTQMEALLLMVMEDVLMDARQDVILASSLKTIASVLHARVRKDIIYLERFVAMQGKAPSLIFKIQAVMHALPLNLTA